MVRRDIPDLEILEFWTSVSTQGDFSIVSISIGVSINSTLILAQVQNSLKEKCRIRQAHNTAVLLIKVTLAIVQVLV